MLRLACGPSVMAITAEGELSSERLCSAAGVIIFQCLAMPELDPGLSPAHALLAYQREVAVQASADTLFAEVAAIGGERGWHFANFLWRWRGHIDRMLGGVGMGRPRRHAEHLQIGDVVDFWRVEAILDGRLIRFAAEMKLPGAAWLQFDCRPQEESQATLALTAIFQPRGAWGKVYWFALYPAHVWLFGGMLRAIAAAAERRQHEVAYSEARP